MEVPFIEAVRLALEEEMAGDPAVYVLGEDVAAGGAFGATRGLVERFGPARVRNTPISEAAITGLAVGAAVAGLRPVVEIMFIDFITLAMDMLVNQAAKYRYMSGGQLSVPLVVRTTSGVGWGAGAQHSQSLESWFVHVPGLLVVAPSDPADAYGLLRAAVRCDDPVLFVEHKRLYSVRGQLDPGAGPIPLGQARVVRQGRDVTVISYSHMTRVALEAAEALWSEGISVEVVDLRSLVPLDVETLVRSVSRTHRVVVAHEAVRSGGVGAEVAARLAEAALDQLDAPVLRVGAPFSPVPFAPELEAAVIPGRAELERAVRYLVR